MSMLSAQCDELRTMAESVGLAMPQAATLMIEAADTIWELRGSVHRERAEADRLRELMRRLISHVEHPPCEGCMAEMNCDGEHVTQCDEWLFMVADARKLGVEVD